MANVTIANPMADRGVITPEEKKLALALKVFAGETLTAFQKASVTHGHALERSISSGKSAQLRALTTSARTFSSPSVSSSLMACSRQTR